MSVPDAPTGNKTNPPSGQGNGLWILALNAGPVTPHAQPCSEVRPSCTGFTGWKKALFGIQKARKSFLGGFSPNTVQLKILITSPMSMLGTDLPPRGRMGNLLILRFTARGFRRLRLDTTRSARISSSTES